MSRRHWRRTPILDASRPGPRRKGLTPERTERGIAVSVIISQWIAVAALPNNSITPLGHLRAIARPGIFDGLRLFRREAFADLLGAARGIKRRLRVTLELRHHLACDQFVAARCC